MKDGEGAIAAECQKSGGIGEKVGEKWGMKQRLRLICAFLAVVLVLSCCQLQSQAEEEIDPVENDIRTWKGFIYGCEGSLEDCSQLTIYNYKGSKRELTIPTKINGIKVKWVYSLSKAKNLRTLHIPDGVEVHYALSAAPKLRKITVSKSNRRYSVKDNALLNKAGTVLMGYPGGYSTLKVPNGVTRIGSELNGERFKSIKWGKNLKRIGGTAFRQNCWIEKVVLKNKVEVIGSDAFSSCIKIKKVVLGKNVKTIGYRAFDGCYKLKSIYIYNRKCKIVPPDKYDYGTSHITIPRKTTIYGWKGSTAERFAKKYKIKFVALKK